MPDLYYSLLNSFGFFLAGHQPDIRPTSFKRHFGKISKSKWVNIIFYADLNNKCQTLHFEHSTVDEKNSMLTTNGTGMDCHKKKSKG